MLVTIYSYLDVLPNYQSNAKCNRVFKMKFANALAVFSDMTQTSHHSA